MYRSIKVIAVLTLALFSSQAIAGGNGQGNIHSRTGFRQGELFRPRRSWF